MNTEKESHLKPVDPIEAVYCKVYEVLAGGSNAVTNDYRSGVLDAIKVIRMARALGPG